MGGHLVNIAIQITCLLIEAADEGVELKVVGNKLKVRAGVRIDADLRQRLKAFKAPITQRLKHGAANPDKLGEFLSNCCVFYAGEGLGVPVREINERYAQWAQSHSRQMASLPALNKRLRTLGCEQVFFQSEPCWEHVALWQFGYVLRDISRQLEWLQQSKGRDHDANRSVEA